MQKVLNTQGLNWGTYVLNDKEFELNHYQSGQKIMQFPYSDISISNASGKNEVAIEFNQPQRKDGERLKCDFLCEMRFYVQNNELQNQG